MPKNVLFYGAFVVFAAVVFDFAVAFVVFAVVK